MPDLADLEHTWTQLEARADAYELARPGARSAPPARTRHIGRVVGAGALMAAVAIGAVVLSGGNPTPRPARTNRAAAGPTAAPVRPQRSTGWTTLPTGHYLVVLDNWPGARFRSVIGVGTAQTKISDSDAYQEVQIVSPQGGFVVKVNQAGGWVPTGGAEVTVDGRPAFYDRFLLHPEIPGHPVPPRPALAWQYAPGAWATIASWTAPITVGTAEQMLAKFRIGVGAPIPSPPPQGP
jgi:hypothetical protein